MDLQTAYRDEIPYEADFMLVGLNGREGLGLLAKDILGSTTKVAGLACTPTSPASLAVLVGPGRIYTIGDYLHTDLGKLVGTGGVDADTAADHQILLQGLLRDTATLTITPPGTPGQSMKYLIEAQLVEADDTATIRQFYNVSNPNVPLSQSVSPRRTTRCVLQLKAGTPATTGSEVAPAADAGWVPVWVVTVANGATSITAPNIVAHGSAPFISIGAGGGGGGTGLSAWETANTAFAVVASHRYIVDTSGGAVTGTLPASPSFGDEVWFAGDWATLNFTLARNGKKIVKAASDYIANKDNQGLHLVYEGGAAPGNWRVINAA